MTRFVFLSYLLVWCSASLHAQMACPKCSPALTAASRSTEAERFVVATSDLPAFERLLPSVAPEAQLLDRYAPASIAVLRCSRAVLLEKIMPLPEVLFADMGHAAGTEERAVPGHNLTVNAVRYVHRRYPGLDGSGTTVSIKEFRFDSTDADLKNRVLLTGKSAPAVTGHATLMATLVAGAGNSDPEARGVARGARVVSSSFVGLLPDADADYTGFDITVQNHAYGVDIENYYGAGALAYDANTRQHPDLLHVFSAGNRGPEQPTAGTYAQVSGFANLSGNFKMAKNVLTVGSVDSFAQVLSFSSRGPAYDGRTKPDLVAFGQNGTSEAASLVSGAAAVVRQAFFEQYGFHPESDLLRVILLASCDDLGAPGPDFSSGYGNLNLKKALELVYTRYMAVGAVSDGETQPFLFQVPPQARHLHVALCWNDVPAAPNAARALVNDLDVVVVAPDGTEWHPWVLNPFPHRDSLLLPARRGRDGLNTTELVRIDLPEPGEYTVRVRGFAVPDGPQAFALAFAWDSVGHFEWTSPVAGDPAVSGKSALLRWQSTWSADTGDLAWKPVGADSWQPVATDVPLATGHWRWLLPDTTAAVQVRMRADGQHFVSDTFLIAPAVRVRVEVNCPDSVLLRWTAAAPGVRYRLWGLGARYLEPLLLTADTALVLHKNTYPQERFAVSVVQDSTAESATSGAPDIAQQGAGCYLNDLFALLNDAEQVDLRLSLGSLYGVDQVFLEKLRAGTWTTLAAEVPSVLEILHTDTAPATGTNAYRARLAMANGAEITGEPVLVYFAGSAGYWVSPNPLAPGQPLAVLARQTEAVPRFFLYDLLGRLIAEQQLEEQRTLIALPPLPLGQYVWVVVGGQGEALGRGKVVVGR